VIYKNLLLCRNQRDPCNFFLLLWFAAIFFLHSLQINEYSILNEYFDFLSIPDTFNNREDLDKNALFIIELLNKAEVKSKLIYDKNKK
jgi:hypothetical protein